MAHRSPVISHQPRIRPADGVRFMFLAMLGIWLVFPLVIKDNLAQDAVPFLAAGDLVGSRPDSIYAADARDLYDLPPEFSKRSCQLSPAGTECSSLNVAFVSAPPAVPFAFGLALLGPVAGVLLARELGALALAGGMLVLWSRLAHRTPRAGICLLFTAILLTPFTMWPLALGQTSPYLFLSACLGVMVTDQPAESRSRLRSMALLIAVSGLWSLSFSLKLFPVALVVVLLWQRRGAIVLAAAGCTAVLTAGALALGPVSLFGRFFTATRVLSSYSRQNPYNGSLDTIAFNLAPALVETTVGSMVLVGLRVSAVAGLAWWGLRHASDDVQWAWVWLALLLFVPLVWWHYLWLAVAAVGVALAGRQVLDDRLVAILPLLAAVTIPISVSNGQGGAWPGAQLVFLLVAVVLAAWLARPATARPGSPRRPEGVGS